MFAVFIFYLLMASKTFDININLVVFKIIFALFILISDLCLHVSSAVSKFVFVYHISSTLDESRLGFGGISIFKILTSAILDFRN